MTLVEFIGVKGLNKKWTMINTNSLTVGHPCPKGGNDAKNDYLSSMNCLRI